MPPAASWTATPLGEDAAVTWHIRLPDEAATLDFGRFLAGELKVGDLVTLSGGLGAGKTTLARVVVQALAGDEGLEVPSPTFTLLQTYDSLRGPVAHADFYRIGGPGELMELGFEEIAERSITLVEWPERAAGALASSRLDIALDLDPRMGPDARVALITPTGDFGARVARAMSLRRLLERAGWADATRAFMMGDASTRAYERLTKPGGETAVLMISPPRPDGPPIRRGKSYSVIAKLAESIHAFVAMDRGLRALGLSAPRIYGEELEAGLLLLEDLGGEGVVDENGPIPERYAEAVTLLARLHATTLPNVLPVAEDREHVVPPYDLEAMLIEVDLLLDWYAPHIARAEIPTSVRMEFTSLWTATIQEGLAGPSTWTLRDYHSPNLLWLPRREGLARVGVIDFQDAVLGPPAYDVVSLLQDARVDVSAELELRLLGHYAKARKSLDPDFDVGAFAGAYAIMGAQRATKILGIFARLDRRDRKPQYLRHLPRIEAYLTRNLRHPALTALKVWYDLHMPKLGGGNAP
jgi:tRNA threonylcarbamoyl adenosine modification protein YjeE